MKLDDFAAVMETLFDVAEVRPLSAVRLAGCAGSLAPLAVVVNVTVVLSVVIVLVERTIR